MVVATTTVGAVDSCLIVGVAPLDCPRGRVVWGRSLGCTTQPSLPPVYFSVVSTKKWDGLFACHLLLFAEWHADTWAIVQQPLCVFCDVLGY